MTALDLFGYLGSVLVAISLMMANIKRLRWINLFGAAAFSSYGFLIDALPVFLLNGWITLVDIYYLIRLYRFQDDFDTVRLSSVRTPLFKFLIDRYGEDILSFFPHASVTELEGAVPLLVFRNMKPVGLFAYKVSPDDSSKADVIIDYVIPEARDMKTAQYLFNRHRNELVKEGINILISIPVNENHKRYLKKVGFIKNNDLYQLTLT